ncbi:MAG: hypothetical protein FJ147_07145 [Deltaproteobacteria bacterium]|nr:hypothetical protein [Deltaproteobacteria bacterium]
MAASHLVHDPEEYRIPLQRFRFLLGNFRGEGRYMRGGSVFRKQLTGIWEAGGRFLGLRMSVTYPLSDGRKDMHDALVIIGAGGTSGSFEAQAYTDSGLIQTYQLEWHGDTVSFADRPATEHGSNIQRARKSLTPTADGFEERVDVDRGDGQFVSYSTIMMKRADDLGNLL